MKEEGVVSGISGRTAKIEIKRRGVCRLCGACNLGLNNSALIEVENNLAARPGNRVELEIVSPYYWQAHFMLYVFPLIGLVSGAIIGRNLIGGEAGSIFLGLSGLIVSFLIVHRWDKKLKGKSDLKPRIVRIID